MTTAMKRSGDMMCSSSYLRGDKEMVMIKFENI